jgi:S1-C subfamily serine protease
MRVGQSLFIMGSPYGYVNFNSVSLGILSSKQRNLEQLLPPWMRGIGWEVLFQSDSAANPGNSGGPVFNMHGEVIGVLVAGMSEGVNYSIPSYTFKDLLEQVRLVHSMSRWEIVSAEVYEDTEEYYSNNDNVYVTH